MKKDPTRIERIHREKIKQYTPAKAQRLFTYFSHLGAQKTEAITPRGRMVTLTIPGRSPFVLIHQ